MFNLMASAGDGAASMFPAIFLAIFGLMWLAIPLMCIVGTIFWVFMLIDCIKRDSLGDNKIIWILVIVFASLLGALIYYFVIKHPVSKIEKAGTQNASVPPMASTTPVPPVPPVNQQ